MICWRCSTVMFSALVERGAQRCDCLSEFEVGLGVVQFGIEGVQLGLQGGLAFAQIGCAGA
jgi:hypothetical protein